LAPQCQTWQGTMVWRFWVYRFETGINDGINTGIEDQTSSFFLKGQSIVGLIQALASIQILEKPERKRERHPFQSGISF